MPTHPRIIRDPEIQDGRPIIAGTDITVESVMRYAVSGANIGQILRIFPRLSEEDVQAAIAYSLPSPFKQFVRDQAFLVAAISFAVVVIGISALGGFQLSLNLGQNGWPILLSLAPIFVPAAAAAVAVFILVRRA